MEEDLVYRGQRYPWAGGPGLCRNIAEYRTGSETAGGTPPWALFSVPAPISALALPDEGL